jgi:hypothetical protein
MEPSTVIRIRQKIESIKEFQRLNAPSRLSYFGYLGEFFLGCLILGQMIISDSSGSLTIFGIPDFVKWVLFIVAVVLISHGLYLIFRFHSDKRIRKILESILSETEAPSHQPNQTKKSEP